MTIGDLVHYIPMVIVWAILIAWLVDVMRDAGKR